MIRKVSILLTLLVIVSVCAEYSPKDALKMVYLSSVSYYSLDSINQWSCPDCQKYQVNHSKAFYYASSNTQGYTGYIPDTN